MTNKKHLHVTVEVSQGGISYLSDTVATVESHIDPNDAAQIVAKNWQTEPGMYFEEDGEWIFEDGMVVKVSKVVEVPPEHFEVLKRYLGEFQIQIETKSKTNWSRN